MKPSDKKRGKAENEQKAVLPPREYDGTENESGIIFTTAEIIDFSQGADS